MVPYRSEVKFTRRKEYGLDGPALPSSWDLSLCCPACIPLSAVPQDWEVQVIPSACDESKAVAIY